MSNVVNLKGRKFGHLTVVDRAGSDNSGRAVWKYECECGTLKNARGKDLIQGKITSCGCMKGKLNETHGLTNSRLYKSWLGMKRRCENKNTCGYENYGGRGIVICEEWKNNFVSFYKWATENNYKKGLSIDRINNNGNYEPENCRWADRIMQQNNTRGNHLITINNETHTMAEWARLYKINYTTLKGRIRRGVTGIALLNN